MKQTIIGWLAAKGIVLANDASDQTVMASVEQAFRKSSDAATALGNDKTAQASRITALENEKSTLSARAQTAESALANEKNARQALARMAAAAITDEAIRRGIKTVAERDNTIAALENSVDFAGAARALFETKPSTKTTGNDTAISGKQQAALGNEEQEALNEYNVAFAKELPMANQDPVKAHNNIMRKPEYKGLAEKLRPKKTA